MIIAKLPKCPECEYLVDKTTQEHVKHSNKTYHKHCHEQFENRKQQRADLHEYICYLYNIPVVNGFILKQLKEYETLYNYKLGGILLALKWFHEVEGNPVDTNESKYNTQGIGIVPYVYDKAKNHYIKMHQIQQSAKDKEIKTEAEIVYVKPARRKKANYIDIEGIK
ncbi:MAG: hypothetical protein WD512_17135 [Candidatus Paceibacterota bacterium]